MNVVNSGISDTGRWSGCPCGVSHPNTAGRPVKGRVVAETLPDDDGVIHQLRSAAVDREKLLRRSYDAFSQGKAEKTAGGWEIDYAGDCQSPYPIRQGAPKGALFVTTWTRCRKCGPCLRAKQFYWSRTATKWAEHTHEQGRRTWFGTLTLDRDSQQEALQDAFVDWATTTGASHAKWWTDPHCDERFRLVRIELVEWVKRYWKRLRKGRKRCVTCYPHKPRSLGAWDHPPASFKYFLVFERHKSGLPHMHWMLHETDSVILKKHLQCAWPHGFTKVNVLKGDEISRAAYYCAKYLGKAYQSRQIASLRYARVARDLGRADRASN